MCKLLTPTMRLLPFSSRTHFSKLLLFLPQDIFNKEPRYLSGELLPLSSQSLGIWRNDIPWTVGWSMWVTPGPIILSYFMTTWPIQGWEHDPGGTHERLWDLSRYFQERGSRFSLYNVHQRRCVAEAATILLWPQEAGVNCNNAIGRSQSWEQKSKKTCVLITLYMSPKSIYAWSQSYRGILT